MNTAKQTSGGEPHRPSPFKHNSFRSYYTHKYWKNQYQNIPATKYTILHASSLHNVMQNQEMESQVLPPLLNPSTSPPPLFFFFCFLKNLLLRLKINILSSIYTEINFPDEPVIKINNLSRPKVQPPPPLRIKWSSPYVLYHAKEFKTKLAKVNKILPYYAIQQWTIYAKNVTDIQTEDSTELPKMICRMISNIQYNGIYTALHHMCSIQNGGFLLGAEIYWDTPMKLGGVSSEDINPQKINNKLLRTVCKQSEVTLTRDNLLHRKLYSEQRENKRLLQKWM